MSGKLGLAWQRGYFVFWRSALPRFEHEGEGGGMDPLSGQEAAAAAHYISPPHAYISLIAKRLHQEEEQLVPGSGKDVQKRQTEWARQSRTSFKLPRRLLSSASYLKFCRSAACDTPRLCYRMYRALHPHVWESI